jgi:hypothetical protein
MCRSGCWIILPILRITFEDNTCAFLNTRDKIFSVEIAWLTRWCAIEFVFTKK